MTTILQAILLAAVSIAAPAPSPTLRYAIDEAQSQVTASVAFLGLSRRTAYFPRVSGGIVIADRADEAITLDVTLDARAITAPDTNMANQLRGAAFFDADRHPSLRFRGTRMKQTGPATGIVAGHLTVRGLTRPVSLTVAFSRPFAQMGLGQPVQIDGRTTINRRDFGMTAYPMIVGRDVTIQIRARLLASENPAAGE